jgi:signal transduction histidine kinase
MMRDTKEARKTPFNGSIGNSHGVPPRPITWSRAAVSEPHMASNLEAVLLAIAAHDLRQPLQVIQSAHELLGLAHRTDHELNLLRIGQAGIDRLKMQLQELAVALRLREIRKSPKLRPIRVEPLLRRACSENAEAAQNFGISIRTVPTEALILSDELLLGAALRNLVSNAIKYSEHGGRILLGCKRFGSNVRIDVYDTGVGIPDGQMPKIFEAFTRLENVQRDGLGIGLFIVHQAIRLLGHRINVTSTPHRGSRFSIFATSVGNAAAMQSRPSQN